jgi:hypothetical protein
MIQSINKNILVIGKIAFMYYFLMIILYWCEFLLAYYILHVFMSCLYHRCFHIYFTSSNHCGGFGRLELITLFEHKNILIKNRKYTHLLEGERGHHHNRLLLEWTKLMSK